MLVLSLTPPLALWGRITAPPFLSMAKGEEAFSRKPSDQSQLTQMVLLSGIPITEYFAHLLTQWKVAIKHITLGF